MRKYISSEYRSIWYGIIHRCTNKNNTNYHRYGGRGIQICEEWKNSLDAFIDYINEHLGRRPTDKHTLGRINNDGNYEPGNVRWETKGEQSRNKHNSIYITLFGETRLLVYWCMWYGQRYSIVYGRIRSGWEPLKALRTKRLKKYVKRKL